MSANPRRAVGLGDLAQLSLRANVAFALRCAQRLRPCFQLPADAVGRREQTAAVDGAIRVAAAFCRGLPAEAGRAAAAAQTAAIVAEETCEFTRFAGYAAVRAAEAVAYAEELDGDPSHSTFIKVVAAAFGAGRVLAANADANVQDLVVAALCADVDKLLEMAHGTSASLGQAFDPAEEGPLGVLWPAGMPPCFAPGPSARAE
jgi:hypothetical protein